MTFKSRGKMQFAVCGRREAGAWPGSKADENPTGSALDDRDAMKRASSRHVSQTK
jgi:hypothetical protein